MINTIGLILSYSIGYALFLLEIITLRDYDKSIINLEVVFYFNYIIKENGVHRFRKWI
jgi:hypothetical protein